MKILTSKFAKNNSQRHARRGRRLSDRQDVAMLKKRLTDVSALVQALDLAEGAKPQKDGLVVRCPFHDDGEASCSVRATNEGMFYRCFSCGAKGDALLLIAKVKALDPKADFAEVMKVATEIADKSATNGATTSTGIAKPELHGPAERLLQRCSLETNSAVTTYLRKRGLLEEAIADRWGALPGDRARLNRLIEELGDDARTLDLCSGAGLPKYADHVLLIPWRGVDGEICLLQRRALTSDAKPKYVMPSGCGATTPYGIDRVSPSEGNLAIVEGAIDVLAYRKLCALENIVRDVIGIAGVTSWKKEWDTLVAGRDVLLSFDNDDAGNSCAVKLAPRFLKAGATSIVRRVPRGANDWAELLEVHL